MILLGCLFLVGISIAPRVMLVLAWIFSDRWSFVWGSNVIVPLLGIAFLPFTTIMYMLVWTPNGIEGWDWMWILLGLVLDASHWGQTFAKRKTVPGYEAATAAVTGGGSASPTSGVAPAAAPAPINVAAPAAAATPVPVSAEVVSPAPAPAPVPQPAQAMPEPEAMPEPVTQPQPETPTEVEQETKPAPMPPADPSSGTPPSDARP
jgi:hypothetical protein